MPDRQIPIRQYADTAANLAASNPVLLNRQLAIETDTGKAKLGNGVNNYNDLIYVFVGGLTGSGTTNKIPKFTGPVLIGDSQITDNGLSGISITNIPAATTDTDKFLVSDGGTLKFRTGSQVFSDIGSISSTGSNGYVAKFTPNGNSLGNSLLQDDGNKISINKNASVTTQDVSTIVTSGVEENISLVLSPKGNGSILGNIPDGTAIGGMARAPYTVDLQLGRSNSNEVAGGQYSALIGGWNNVTGVDASSSGIFTGNRNAIAGSSTAAILAGRYNNINGSFGSGACILGGEFNTVTSASGAIILGGVDNSVSSNSIYSITGGRSAQSTMYGQRTMGAGSRTQTLDVRLFRSVITPGKKQLFLDGQSFIAIIPDKTIWNVNIQFSALVTSKGDSSFNVGDSYFGNYNCCIKNIGGTVSLLGTLTDLMSPKFDASMSTCLFEVSAETSTSSLRLDFTPPSTYNTWGTIRVIATLYMTQAGY